MPKQKQKKPDESLKGWTAIAKFLSQPTSTVQRWANEGMPVTRIGRYVAASPAVWSVGLAARLERNKLFTSPLTILI